MWKVYHILIWQKSVNSSLRPMVMVGKWVLVGSLELFCVSEGRRVTKLC